MTAYLIVDLDVEDLSALDDYRRQASPILAKYGGRMLVRPVSAEVLEGDWTPKRLMVLEFETMEALDRWWTSEDYHPLKPLRQRVSKAGVVAVNGV
jgi:uncharacterized protein (DUF1330 family)